MAKISELGRITGDVLKSGDLFVVVNLEQGDNGTKNITRAELVRSIQEEEFNNITITGGSLSNIDLNIQNEHIPNLEDNDYFVIKDIGTNTTRKITYKEIQDEFAQTFASMQKVYVSETAPEGGNGSHLQPFNTLEQAFEYAEENAPVGISVLPGTYYTNGNLPLPDYCAIVSTNGQYVTNIVMNDGFENENAILVGSGGYVQGFSFNNMEVDDFDNPTGGFGIAFRPNATILRSPYIRDCSQISNYNRETIAAPLNPRNSQGTIEDLGGDDFPNPLVGRGGGVILADRAVLDQDSIFPYVLAFGATPRSPNGLGYVAKNGAGINGIGSITIFQRCAFYALNGGQITLNNSGTQFGDISMRAKGTTTVVDPYETNALIVKSETLSNEIDAQTENIISAMLTDLSSNGYTVDEELTRRDAGYLLKSVSFDFLAGTQTSSRNFIAGFFDYKGDYAFNTSFLDAFVHSYEFIRDELKTLTPDLLEKDMIDGLFDDIIIQTIQTPQKIDFGSLIESIGHQFNLAGAGVNRNALPLNFRRVGTPLAASGSVLEEEGGRVRWSGADELNNQYFARGLKINGRTGRLEGRPFTSSVRRLARRAANSRTFT